MANLSDRLRVNAPEGVGFWRVSLYGAIQLDPGTPENSTVEVLFSRLNFTGSVERLVGDQDEYLRLARYPTTERSVRRFHVADVPYLSLGSIWHKQKRVDPNPRYPTYTLRGSVQGSEIETHAIAMHLGTDKSNKDEYLIPLDQYSFPNTFRDSQVCLLNEDRGQHTVIIPSLVVLNGLVAKGHSKYMRQLLTDPWEIFLDTLLDHERSDQLCEENPHLHFKKPLTDNAHINLAFIHASEHSRFAMMDVFNSMCRQIGDDRKFPVIKIPCDSVGAATFKGVWIKSNGVDRFLVYEIESFEPRFNQKPSVTWDFKHSGSIKKAKEKMGPSEAPPSFATEDVPLDSDIDPGKDNSTANFTKQNTNIKLPALEVGITESDDGETIIGTGHRTQEAKSYSTGKPKSGNQNKGVSTAVFHGAPLDASPAKFTSLLAALKKLPDGYSWELVAVSKAYVQAGDGPYSVLPISLGEGTRRRRWAFIDPNSEPPRNRQILVAKITGPNGTGYALELQRHENEPFKLAVLAAKGREISRGQLSEILALCVLHRGVWKKVSGQLKAVDEGKCMQLIVHTRLLLANPPVFGMRIVNRLEKAIQGDEDEHDGEE